MLLPGRHANTSDYRYGFNGKETDNEVKGEGAQYDYGFRIYDPRLGRFLSTDPLFKEYPYYTPYQFAGNKPIESIDIDGLEEFHFTLIIDNETGKGKLKYSHSKDIIDKVSIPDGWVATSTMIYQKYKTEKRVNQRQTMIIDTYDASYGRSSESSRGNELTTGQYVSKYGSPKSWQGSSLSDAGSFYGYASTLDAYDYGALSSGKNEISNREKDQIDFDTTLFIISVLTEGIVSGYWSKVGKIDEAVHGHHSFPKALGGSHAQELSYIVESLHTAKGGIHSQLSKFEGGWLFPKKGMTGAQIIEKFGQDKVIEGLRRFYQQADWRFLIDDFEKAVEFTAKSKKN